MELLKAVVVGIPVWRDILDNDYDLIIHPRLDILHAQKGDISFFNCRNLESGMV